MPASHELITLKGLSKQSYLTVDEQARFRPLCQKWVKDNPKATVPQITLFEDYLVNHLLLQRLRDKRYFFDGSRTSYTVIDGRKVSELEEDDAKIKAREFKEWYQPLMAIETHLLKLALAEKIEITGDFDLTSLIQEYQARKNAKDATDHIGSGCRSS